MSNELNHHTPRYEQHNLFFYAALGAISHVRRLGEVLSECFSPEDHSPNGRALGKVQGSTLDYLLLGTVSFQQKALSHLLALVADGSEGTAEPRNGTVRRGGLLR